MLSPEADRQALEEPWKCDSPEVIIRHTDDAYRMFRSAATSRACIWEGSYETAYGPTLPYLGYARKAARMLVGRAVAGTRMGEFTTPRDSLETALAMSNHILSDPFGACLKMHCEIDILVFSTYERLDPSCAADDSRIADIVAERSYRDRIRAVLFADGAYWISAYHHKMFLAPQLPRYVPHALVAGDEARVLAFYLRWIRHSASRN